MKTYACLDCNKTNKYTREKKPARCCVCLARLRKMQAIACKVCGVKLNPKSARSTEKCRTCFLRAGSRRFKEVDVDDAFGNWLSGFVAGEGNFQANTKGSRGGFVFRIILREDDKPILEEIRMRLGVGVLYYRDIKNSMHNWNPKYQSLAMRNQWEYMVQSIVDLIEVIIPLFSTYPLRAKKQQQFNTWVAALSATRGYKLLTKEVSKCAA
jgi:hypothetical protein